jgi:uncharacterized protein with HEPN domain
VARREQDRLADIARAIADIEGFVAGMDAASFAGDTRTLLAVQAAFTVIGEAIKASRRRSGGAIPMPDGAGTRVCAT